MACGCSEWWLAGGSSGRASAQLVIRATVYSYTLSYDKGYSTACLIRILVHSLSYPHLFTFTGYNSEFAICALLPELSLLFVAFVAPPTARVRGKPHIRFDFSILLNLSILVFH